ncbi:MAG: hypothetical protein OEY89_12785 [Gammaproteobacteria bacterium]|nr:hypothetical protein [Gammaproteobacteria bacterium]
MHVQPNYASALTDQSNTLDDLGQINDAEKNCRHAIEVDPNYAPA